MVTTQAPTVGRIVWYYHHSHDPNQQPLAAIIASVCGPDRVNLAAFDADGQPFPTQPTSVLFVQDSGQIPTSGRNYCTWPKREEPAAAVGERVIPVRDTAPVAADGVGGGGDVAGGGAVDGSPLADSVTDHETEADTDVESEEA